MVLRTYRIILLKNIYSFFRHKKTTDMQSVVDAAILGKKLNYTQYRQAEDKPYEIDLVA